MVLPTLIYRDHCAILFGAQLGRSGFFEHCLILMERPIKVPVWINVRNYESVHLRVHHQAGALPRCFGDFPPRTSYS
jgi:hypothetical protein